jgi:hypothetical protein
VLNFIVLLYDVVSLEKNIVIFVFSLFICFWLNLRSIISISRFIQHGFTELASSKESNVGVGLGFTVLFGRCQALRPALLYFLAGLVACFTVPLSCSSEISLWSADSRTDRHTQAATGQIYATVDLLRSMRTS